jgi:hypothetical protein
MPPDAAAGGARRPLAPPPDDDPAAATGPLAPARFLYQHLHDAIRSELAALVDGVATLEGDGAGAGATAGAPPPPSPGAALAAVRARCRFLARVYKYHSAVEDEVRGKGSEAGRWRRQGRADVFFRAGAAHTLGRDHASGRLTLSSLRHPLHRSSTPPWTPASAT